MGSFGWNVDKINFIMKYKCLNSYKFGCFKGI